MTARRRALLVALAGATAPLPRAAAAAQDQYPSRPVRIVAPFAPGGSSDITARVIAGHMEARAGQSVVVDNRAGIQGVPYRAIGAAFSDLLAGRLHLVFVDTVARDAWLRDNRLRALAITRERRWDRWPDLPAMSETYPEFGMSGFLGVAAPAGTPRAVCERLNALCNEAMTTEPAKGKMTEMGFHPEAFDLARIADLAEIEREKWARYVRLAGIEPE